MTTDLRIGCSSWTSEAWWDRLYPRSLADGERIGYYARLYPAVEVDATYYAPPRALLSQRWRRATPEGFLFTAKMTRDLLDWKSPVDAGKLDAFVRELGPLNEKLGAILLQFPPSFRPANGARFLEELLPALPSGPRYSVEFRDPHWFSTEERPKLLRRLADREVALAWSFLSFVRVPWEVTTDFLYVRFIGDHTTVPASEHGSVRVDRTETMRTYAERVREQLEELERIYVFFNNHFAGFAPASVNTFRGMLGLRPIAYAPPPERGPAQRRLDQEP